MDEEVGIKNERVDAVPPRAETGRAEAGLHRRIRVYQIEHKIPGELLKNVRTMSERIYYLNTVPVPLYHNTKSKCDNGI